MQFLRDDDFSKGLGPVLAAAVLGELFFELMPNGNRHRRLNADPECSVVQVEGRRALRLTWDNVRSFASDAEGARLHRMRTLVSEGLRGALQRHGMYTEYIGNAPAVAGYLSDVDVQITSTSQRAIFEVMLSETGLSRRVEWDTLRKALEECFDINWYPSNMNLKEVMAPSGAPVDLRAIGDSSHRLRQVTDRLNLRRHFDAIGLGFLLDPTPSNCDGEPDINRMATVEHCRYSSNLTDVYNSLGGFMLTVLKERKAKNRDWYLLAAIDNLGFAVQALYGPTNPCHHRPLATRVRRMAKYIARMSDALQLHSLNTRRRQALLRVEAAAELARAGPTRDLLDALGAPDNANAPRHAHGWLRQLLAFMLSHLSPAQALLATARRKYVAR